MSHQTYDSLWSTAQELLASTLQSEPTQADAREQRTLLVTLYLRYIIISNRLSEVIDQIVQPQKRLLIRKILEAVLGRVLELKNDLVEADLNEYTHFGEVLSQLGLTPLHTQLVIPPVFKEERSEEIKYRREFIQTTLDKIGELGVPVVRQKMSNQEAVLIVQAHERARQGRLRAQFMKEIKTLKEKERGKPAVQGGGEISLPAAMRIQKVWRGYMARRATRRRKLQEMLLIGMIPHQKKESLEVTNNKITFEKRKLLQIKNSEDLDRLTKDTKENLLNNQKGIILEQLGDQVRSWLYEYKEQTGKIPEYTGSERSTSRMLMSRQGTGTDSELSKSSSKDSKKSKSSAKEKENKENEDGEEETAVKATVSLFLPALTIHKDEYDETWRNKDESSNPHQDPYVDLIEKQETLALENELRRTVDDMMRTELQLLQEALDRDKGHKGKKPKKASKKMRRSGKKSKKKKEKDLTPDRTTESLFEELVANGIIKLCPEVPLKDYIGENSYNSSVAHNVPKEPKICVGDLRQVIAENCILPLLTQQLHETTPLVKSVLLTGAVGSGKDMLVYAACHEAGATLFDLTPSNIAGKYPGKSGLIMLLHLVTKVARLLQPSVIYMDNAERPFVKKVPKSDKSDPKRLKKDLPKLVKNFCTEERIMLIGATNCPWEADQKLLAQVYQKFLIIPKPDYSSRFALWTHLLGEYNAISWQFDYSGVTKISDGYSIGAIVETVNEVMTVKRKLQLRVKQLSPLELINGLAKRTPIYKEEEEALLAWWTKAPMAKRRQKAVEQLLEMEDETKTKQAKAKR